MLYFTIYICCYLVDNMPYTKSFPRIPAKHSAQPVDRLIDCKHSIIIITSNGYNGIVLNLSRLYYI